MLLPIIIFAALAAVGPPRTFPVRSAPEAVADSLYDAEAIDSLQAFAAGMISRAEARGDSVLLGRMTLHRGRARLALRDPRALSDFDLALAVATVLGDSIGCMHALGLKAFVAVNQGHFVESIALNERRIALARALGRRGSEGWGHMLVGYAELYRENYARAKSEYEEAWLAFGEVERPREQLSASIGLARALVGMGRYDEGRTSYQRAWLTARELGDRGQEADAINNLGVVEQEHGELSLAAGYFDRAYRIKRDLRSFDVASVARNLARVDIMIGRHAHAESTLVEAMAIGNRGMLDAGMMVELGQLRLARNRFRGAADCLREVLSQRASVPVKTRVEAVTHLATALSALDSLPAAVTMMDREFGALRSDPPSAWRADALLEWSRCMRAMKDASRARDLARAAWKDAEARRDSTQMVLAAAGVSLGERALGHDADASAWFEIARALHDASRVAGEFQWREARRATMARALIQSGDVLRAYPPSASDEERHRALFDFLQHLHSRTLLERATDPRRFADIDARLLQPVTSAALQADVLEPGECFFSASAGDGCFHLFALTKREFRARVIDDTDGSVTRRIRNYIRLTSRAPAGNASPEVASRALGEMLFGDLAPALRGSTRIIASLDGFLAASPFETLVCPGESGPLVVSHEVVRVPSAAFLRYLRARADPVPSASSLLAIAAGDPALRGARDEVKHLASRFAGASRSIDPDREDFLASLSHFDVIHVASHVHVESERPWHSGILIGRASGASLSRRDAADSTVAGPLALSSSDSSEIARTLPADLFVRASEIANRRLDARLVVLSACESALGRATLAEGVLGIASSFVSAGSRAVVASLWEVDDRTTADLMKLFYRELAKGRTTAAALRSAQLAVRESRPAPFFWAGFVVIGDGDVVANLEPRRPDGLVLGFALAGLTLIMAVPWVVWRRRRRAVRMSA